jgi:hypothetical protein
VVKLYRVTYRDGRSRLVPADKYGPYGDCFVFTFDGEESSIARRDVESVMLAAIPGPGDPEEPPEPPRRPFGFGH